jgi:signal transduction histidine kinase
MIRLFFPLYFLVLVGIIIFVFGFNGVSQYILEDMLDDVREQQLGGIVTQLDEEIKGLNPQQRQQRIQHIQNLFYFDVRLQNIDALELSERNKQRLYNGEFVSVIRDQAEFVYHASMLEDMSWMLQIEGTLSEDDRKFLQGPLALMNQRLAAVPNSEWARVVADIDQQFGIPIHLIAFADIQTEPLLNEEHRQMLRAGEPVLLFNNEDLEYVFSPIPNSQQLLKVGRIGMPFLLSNFAIVVVLLLAGFLGMVILPWLRPIWLDLRKLQRASHAFGQGQLATRIHVSRYSFIKSILDAFNGMASHIESLINSHKTLTNAVSHELRTPVARLRFSLEMLEKAGSDADKQRYLQAMNTDIDELDNMLADLLSYARMDRQCVQLNKEPLQLEPWLQEQVAAASDYCGAVQINTCSDALPADSVACMDHKLMTRAVQNLLQNACRYAKSQIQLCFIHKNGQYQLSVDDDGCGIPAELHDSIFDPFTRVDDSRDRDSGGYGLGLAIVKQVAQAHQGTVSIQNSELGGVKFVLNWTEVTTQRL